MSTYKFEVKTADEYLAGTDSNIFVILHGEVQQSNEVRLNGYISGNAFERDSLDKFEIPFDDLGGDLGRVYKIDLRSDCKYGGSDWRVSYLTVTRNDGDDTLLQNVLSKFIFNMEIDNEDTHTRDVQMEWKNQCKYESVNEDYSQTPLYLAAGETYEYNKTTKTTSGFHYSEVITKENTTKFNAEMGGSASYGDTKKDADKLENKKSTEAYVKFAFEKGFTESRVEETVKKEDKELSITQKFTLKNDSDATKEYQVIYQLQKIKAVVTIDTLVGEFSVGEKIFFAGVKNVTDNKMEIAGEI
jgi:hypothetical protein